VTAAARPSPRASSSGTARSSSTRKHTGKVGAALSDIRRIVEELVAKRDARRDGFAAVIKKAMEQTLGEDAEEAMKALTKNGIPRGVAKKALERSRSKRDASRSSPWSMP